MASMGGRRWGRTVRRTRPRYQEAMIALHADTSTTHAEANGLARRNAWACVTVIEPAIACGWLRRAGIRGVGPKAAKCQELHLPIDWTVTQKDLATMDPMAYQPWLASRLRRRIREAATASGLVMRKPNVIVARYAVPQRTPRTSSLTIGSVSTKTVYLSRNPSAATPSAVKTCGPATFNTSNAPMPSGFPAYAMAGTKSRYVIPV